MQWDVSAWGQWKLSGRCTDAKNDKVFEAEVVAVCSQDAGVVLRAPTQDEGLEYFCKDSFLAQTTLSLWELEYDATSKEYRRGEVIIDKAVSSQGAVEVGGGPWWSPWRGVSRMKQPMKFLVGLPYRFSRR
uniref:Uncharacterized protein n=1 Tax=Craspedostauros australis TaxID=1486917 RepID=A0A7R9WVA5_9STRA